MDPPTSGIPKEEISPTEAVVASPEIEAPQLAEKLEGESDLNQKSDQPSEAEKIIVEDLEVDGDVKEVKDQAAETEEKKGEEIDDTEARIEAQNKSVDEIVPADSEPDVKETEDSRRENEASEVEEIARAKPSRKSGNLMSKFKQSIVKVKKAFGGKSKSSNSA